MPDPASTGFDQGYFSAVGVLGTPDDASADPEDWVDAGRIFTAENPTAAPGTRNDAMNRPVQTAGTVNMSVEFVDGNRYNRVAQFDNGTPCNFAVRKPNGAFRVYRSAYVEVDYMPNAGADNVQTFMAYVRGAESVNLTPQLGIIALPA